MTQIRVSNEIRERLKGFGKKGETYDTVLTRLMDIAEGGVVGDTKRI